MSKKVKAPLTHDPGKGRPKEHLAYLNWQEMEALRRLNGGNTEVGPKGIPSFADDSASSMGVSRPPSGSTTRSTSYGSGTSTSWGGRSTGTGGSGSTRGSTASYPSRGTVTPAGGGGNRPSGGGPTRTTGGGGMFQSAADKVVQHATAVMNAFKAASNSALKQDVQNAGGIKSINVGPMQTPVKIGGGQVTGAISRVKTQARDEQGPIPSSVSPEQYGWSSTGPSMLAAHQGMKIYGGDLAAQKRSFTQKQLDTLLDVNTFDEPGFNKMVMGLPEQARRNAAILSSAASLQGMSPKTAIKLGAAESLLGTLPDRPGAPYVGLTQMGPSEFSSFASPSSAKLGRTNPWASAQAGLDYAQQNAAAFQKKFGRAPTEGELYGMHQQGAGGFSKLLSNLNAPAYKSVGYDAVYGNLPGRLRNEKIARTITGGEFAKIVGATPGIKLGQLVAPPGREIQAEPASEKIPIPTPRPPMERVAGLMLDTGELPPDAAKSIVDIFRNPKSINKLAQEGDWNAAGDKAQLAKVQQGVQSLIKQGARITSDGRNVTIPKSAAPAAQKVYDDLVNAYTSFPSFAPEFGSISKPTTTVVFSPEQKAKDQPSSPKATSVVMTDPRVNIAPGAYPAAPKRSAAGTLTSPYDATRTSTASLPVGDPRMQFGIGSLFSTPAMAEPLTRGIAKPLAYNPLAGIGAATTPMKQFYDRIPAAPTPSSLAGYDPLSSIGEYTTPMQAPVGEGDLGDKVISVGGSGDMKISEALDMYDLSPGARRRAAQEIDKVASDTGEISEENLHTILQSVGDDAAEVAGMPSGTYWTGTGLTDEQQAGVDAALRKQKIAGAGAGAFIPGAGAAMSLANWISGNSIDKYAKATVTERREMELRNPALIGWAKVAGLQPVNDYSVYTAWAQRMGLSGGADTGKSGRGRDTQAAEDKTAEDTTTPAAPQASIGRPYKYYQWDLGINIPSPGDPEYTEYQKYLATRASAQASLGLG